MHWNRRRALGAAAIAVVFAVTGVAVSACKRSETAAPAGAAPSASSVAAAASSSAQSLAAGIPIPAAAVASVVNPKGAKPYEGPFGSISGVVRVKGDPPPDVPNLFIPHACPEAKAMYAKLFREGANGELADAIVGATEYEQFVPALADAKEVKIHGCAYDARSITVTFGQRLEIVNTDAVPYLPQLVGARMPALMVAMPKGEPISIYPQIPGRYALKDDLMHPWMQADVTVLKYPTHAVTDADGKYRIDRVPVGRVKVSIIHPAIPHLLTREVEVKADQIATSDFVIPFDAKKDYTPPPPAPSASPSASHRAPVPNPR